MATINNVSVIENNTSVVNISATDSDGDDLTITVINNPSFATFTDNGDGTAKLNVNPQTGDAGSYTVTVTVSDGSNTDAKSFDILVQEVNLPVVTETIEIIAGKEDVIVAQNGTFPGGVLYKLGKVPYEKTACFVMPFKLPSSGITITGAEFKFVVSGGNTVGGTNVDLYGIPKREVATVLKTDYYGGLDAGSGKLQDNILASGFETGNVATNAIGSANLLQFIKNEYDNNGAEKFVFLRLSPDNITTLQQWYINSADNTTGVKPTLVLTYTVETPLSVSITASSGDGFVSDPTKVVNDSQVLKAGTTTEYMTVKNPQTINHLKLGNSDDAGNTNLTSVIIPFKLPSFPTGKNAVVGAELDVFKSFGRDWFTSNIDLYGLESTNVLDVISANDYYSGSFGNGNGNDVGIEDDLFKKLNTLGLKDVEGWVSTSKEDVLVNYINSIYKEGEYIFFRLSVDNNSYDANRYQYFAIDGSNGTTMNELGINGISNSKPAVLKLDFENKITSTTTWNGTAWSNGLPNSNKTVIIDANFNIGGANLNGNEIFAKSLTVNAGKELKVYSGKNLYVSNSFTINGKVVIENGGSFKSGSSLTNIVVNGEYIVNRDARATINDYTYWSSPVETTVQKSLLNTGADLAFSYNTKNYNDADNNQYDDNGDSWKRETGSSMMIPGKGYIARWPGTDGNSSVHKAIFGVQNGGVVNSGNITLPIYLSADVDDGDGNPDTDVNDQNIIGNPYSSAISIKRFLKVNETKIIGTIHVWTHTTGIVDGKYLNDDYASYNATGGTFGVDEVDVLTEGIMASGQGFYVDAEVEGSVTFTPDMQVLSIDNTYGNSNFYKRNNDIIETTGDTIPNRFWINVNNQQSSNQILVGFNANATDGFDNLYDGDKADNGSGMSFYSLIDDRKLVIQGKKEFTSGDVVKLGYTSTNLFDSEFTIELVKVEGELLNSPIILLDKYSGETIDLQKISHTFSVNQAEEVHDRFEILFMPKNSLTDIDLTYNAEIEVYPNPTSNYFTINDKTNGIEYVSVYDVNGVTVKKFNKQEKYDITELKEGLYFVKITSKTSNEVVVKIIKN